MHCVKLRRLPDWLLQETGCYRSLAPFEHVTNARLISAAKIIEPERGTHVLLTAKTCARLIVPRNGLLEKPDTFLITLLNTRRISAA